MSELAFRINLLFYPECLQRVVQSWPHAAPDSDLLQRHLETPDWTLAQLSEVAMYHHVRQQLAKAMQYYQRILDWSEHQPRVQGEIMGCVGHVFWLGQHFKDAAQAFSLALRLAPEQIRLLYLLADSHLHLRAYAPALAALKKFVAVYPHDDELKATAYRKLARLQDMLGDAGAAQASYRAGADKMANWALALQADLYQPLLPSPDQSAPPELPAWTPPASERWWGVEFNEWYPYRHLQQHADPTAYLQQTAQRQCDLLYALMPPQPARALSGQRRIVIVGDLQQPAAAPYLEAIVALSRKRSVTVIAIGNVPPLLSQEDWMRTYPVNAQLGEMRHAITSQDPDVLIYLDLGPSSVLNRLLAAYPLAPVQALWGAYPVTSGLSTVQHFLSFDWLEPEGAEAHYSEQLVRLPGMVPRSVWMPDRFLAPEFFNLPADRHTFLCPVAPTAITPVFAGVLADILRRDPAAQILLQGYLHPEVDQQFLQRFREAYPDVYTRLYLLPQVNEQALLSLIRAVDLVLDPVHQSLTHAAWRMLLLGTPVLTWQGPYARDRYLSGLYTALELTDSVVTEIDAYAERAVTLIQQAGLKARYREHVATHRSRIFQHDTYLQALNDWIESVLV